MEDTKRLGPDVFQDELELIKDERIQNLVTDVLDRIYKTNIYFFKAQASSSGKYHPSCCNAPGGLIRHVKRAVEIGVHLCRAYELGGCKRDIIIAAIILHDIRKDKYQTHARIAGDEIMKVVTDNSEKYLQREFATTAIASIVRCVRLHMGPWTEKQIRIPISQYTMEELIVYTADYLSSREDIAMASDDFPLDYEELRKVV